MSQDVSGSIADSVGSKPGKMFLISSKGQLLDESKAQGGMSQGCLDKTGPSVQHCPMRPIFRLRHCFQGVLPSKKKTVIEEPCAGCFSLPTWSKCLCVEK